MKEYLRGALLSETSLKVTASLIIGGVATVAAAPLLAPFAATAMATASIPIVGAASSAVTGFLFLSTTALCTCAGYGMIVTPLFAGGKALYGLLNTTFNKINQLFEVVKKITNFLGLDAEDEKVKELETKINNAQRELGQVREGLENSQKKNDEFDKFRKDIEGLNTTIPKVEFSEEFEEYIQNCLNGNSDDMELLGEKCLQLPFNKK